jgi:adenosyl cobinamide kinase/adenosyl cobinamide phosphate guanylyltransferase
MSGFAWHERPADSSLAATLNRINRESNIFRADRRVLVVDSLSGWLRDYLLRARQAGCDPGGPEDWAASPLQEVTAALLSFQGKRIVVSEEASAGLAEDPWERRYAWELAAAIRRLAEESHAVYRLTAGFAAELKGHRVNRGRTKDENLYPNRG